MAIDFSSGVPRSNFALPSDGQRITKALGKLKTEIGENGELVLTKLAERKDKKLGASTEKTEQEGQNQNPEQDNNNQVDVNS